MSPPSSPCPSRPRSRLTPRSSARSAGCSFRSSARARRCWRARRSLVARPRAPGRSLAALRGARRRAALRDAARTGRPHAATGGGGRARESPTSPRSRRPIGASSLEMAESQAASTARSMRLGDDMVVVVLARVLSALVAAAPAAARPARRRCRSTPSSCATSTRSCPPVRGRASRRTSGRSSRPSRAAACTCSRSPTRSTSIRCGSSACWGRESAAAGALAHVDLLAALSSPSANDIVNFSLELLPSVLETRRAHATGTHAVARLRGGRAQGVDRLDGADRARLGRATSSRGACSTASCSSTRASRRRQARRLHYLVIDASASMRGDREVFARGLAIALGKKLQLAGEEVWMRFFDSRLYDVQRTPGRAQLPGGVAARLQGRARAKPCARLCAAGDRDWRSSRSHDPRRSGRSPHHARRAARSAAARAGGPAARAPLRRLHLAERGRARPRVARSARGLRGRRSRDVAAQRRAGRGGDEDRRGRRPFALGRGAADETLMQRRRGGIKALLSS